MAWCEMPFISTCGEAQARYVVGPRKPLLLIFSGMIPGGQDKFDQEFPGRLLGHGRVQLRIDGSQSRVQVRRGGHSHRRIARSAGSSDEPLR